MGPPSWSCGETDDKVSPMPSGRAQLPVPEAGGHSLLLEAGTGRQDLPPPRSAAWPSPCRRCPRRALFLSGFIGV